MPYRYRFIGDAPGFVPAIHRELQPGEEFDSDLELESSVFESLTPSLADLDVEPEKVA